MAVHVFDTLRRMTDRPALVLLLGDVVRLRKPHPCGGDTWLVDRLGADLGIRCETCAPHVPLERRAPDPRPRPVLGGRRALDRRIAGFVRRGDADLTAAITPAAR